MRHKASGRNADTVPANKKEIDTKAPIAPKLPAPKPKASLLSQNKKSAPLATKKSSGLQTPPAATLPPTDKVKATKATKKTIVAKQKKPSVKQKEVSEKASRKRGRPRKDEALARNVKRMRFLSFE